LALLLLAGLAQILGQLFVKLRQRKSWVNGTLLTAKQFWFAIEFSEGFKPQLRTMA
jgi:hypothetical protein